MKMWLSDWLRDLFEWPIILCVLGALLLTVALRVFGAEVPKPLSQEQRVEFLQAELKSTKASAEFADLQARSERILNQLREQLRQAEESAKGAQSARDEALKKLRKVAGAADICTLTETQEWKCEELKKEAATASPSVAKPAAKP